MKNVHVDMFESLNGQLMAFHSEITTLVKKSPNDAVNKFKLGLVNSVLRKSNSFLGAKRLPFADFEAFGEETMPSTSDVLMIIGQYLAAFEKLRTENITLNYQHWYWVIEDGNEENKRHTAPPKVLE